MNLLSKNSYISPTWSQSDMPVLLDDNRRHGRGSSSIFIQYHHPSIFIFILILMPQFKGVLGEKIPLNWIEFDRFWTF